MSWLIQVFTLETRKVLAYRIDFWGVFILGTLATVGIAHFLWQAVFAAQGVTEMQGYTLSGIVLYYLMIAFNEKITHGPDMGFLSQDIYDGSLTRYLLYPVSAFLYKGCAFFAHSFVYYTQLLFALAVYFYFWGLPTDITLTPESFILGSFALMGSTLLFFSLAFFVEQIAFWADNVWSLHVMLRFITNFLGGAMVPLTFFPEALERPLWFLPFPYLVSFPVLTLLGKPTPVSFIQGIFISALWISFFMIVSRVVWARGTRHYTGVGI